eukprot:GFYU01002593.1.p1 GENE.GFYU01002593.1~~GFYU01002593.1.p1  ORF type:complete len:1088 (-),score=409.96 GFYU01002593.1:118-3381(-)
MQLNMKFLLLTFLAVLSVALAVDVAVTVDGVLNVNEWDSTTRVYSEPTADAETGSDGNELHVRETSDSFYFAVTFVGAAPSEWRLILFVDADDDLATGYTVNSGLLGAEVMIQSGIAYVHDSTDSSAWTWKQMAALAPLLATETVSGYEAKVPKTLLGNPTQFKYAVFIDNNSVDDWLPDATGSNPTAQVVVATGGDVLTSVVPEGATVNTNGWSVVTTVHTDAVNADIDTLHMAETTTHAIFGVQFAAGVSPDLGELRLYIDQDSSVASGYDVNGIGAEFKIHGVRTYRHDGLSATQNVWARKPRCAPESVVSTGAGGEKVWEVKISKVCLMNPTSFQWRVVVGAQTPVVTPDGSVAAVTSTMAASYYQSHAPRASLRHITTHSQFIVYYGHDYSQQVLDELSLYDFIVLNPQRALELTPAKVQYIKTNGRVPKTVLGYISVGEDTFTEVTMLKSTDPGSDGTLSGPVYYDNDVQALQYLDLGSARYYVDSCFGHTCAQGHDLDSDGNVDQWYGDGIPDTNEVYGGRFVVPTMEFLTHLKTARTDGTVASIENNPTGLDQLLGTAPTGAAADDRANDFGFDGLMVDALDMACPWNTAGCYPWAAAEISNALGQLRQWYPDTILFINRAYFYFDPFITSAVYGTRPYDYHVGQYIDGVVFESFELDSVAAHVEQSPSFRDNSCVMAPKIELAAREYGLIIASAQYKMGRWHTLFSDAYTRATETWGYLNYYATDLSINTIDDTMKVLESKDAPDTKRPRFPNSALGQPSHTQYPGGECLYDERRGVGEAFVSSNAFDVEVLFEIAVDESWPITYNIYRTKDQGATFEKVEMTQMVVNPVWEGFAPWWEGPKPYPLKATVPCAEDTDWYQYKVEAVDAAGNSDGNNVLSLPVTCASINHVNPGDITVDGEGDDWASLTFFEDGATLGDPNYVEGAAAYDETFIYLWFKFSSTGVSFYSLPRVLLHVNGRNSDTDGYIHSSGVMPIGATYVIENGQFVHKRTEGVTDPFAWAWSYVKELPAGTYQTKIDPTDGTRTMELKIDRVNLPEFNTSADAVLGIHLAHNNWQYVTPNDLEPFTILINGVSEGST